VFKVHSTSAVHAGKVSSLGGYHPEFESVSLKYSALSLNPVKQTPLQKQLRSFHGLFVFILVCVMGNSSPNLT